MARRTCVECGTTFQVADLVGEQKGAPLVCPRGCSGAKGFAVAEPSGPTKALSAPSGGSGSGGSGKEFATLLGALNATTPFDTFPVDLVRLIAAYASSMDAVATITALANAMSPPVASWLGQIADSLRESGELTLSAHQFSRIAQFLMLIRWLDAQGLFPSDTTEMTRFVLDVFLPIPAIGGLMPAPRVLPGFSTGVSFRALEADRRSDLLRYVTAIKGFHNPLVKTKAVESKFQSGHSPKYEITVGPLFKHLSEQLESARRVDRQGAQEFIRHVDTTYRFTQGFIYLPFVAANGAALVQLLDQIDGADAVISQERGGSYLSDQLELIAQLLGRRFPCSLKVRKPTDAETLTANAAANRASLSKIDKKSVHLLMLVKTVLDLFPTHGQFNLVVTETIVGGGSTNLLLKGLACLAILRPNVAIRLLLHRHTLHQSTPQHLEFSSHLRLTSFGVEQKSLPLDADDVGQVLNLASFVHAEGAKLCVVYEAVHAALPPSVSARLGASGIPWRPGLAITLRSGRYLLGEDIDIFLGKPQQRPLVLFDDRSSYSGVVRIDPGAMLDARRLLHLVVGGAFDLTLASLGFAVPRSN